MSTQPTQMNFFVYLVESPSDTDKYHRRSEEQIIKFACSLAGLKFDSREAISREAFEASIQLDFLRTAREHPNSIPILHISAHGNSDGICLSDKTFLFWSELRSLLAPINKRLGGRLILCMSSCKGYLGSRMAMFLEDINQPFLAMIGNSGDPCWSDTAVAYTVLYHRLAKNTPIVDAVDAMRASGNKDFFLTTASDAKHGYIQFLVSQQTATVSGL